MRDLKDRKTFLIENPTLKMSSHPKKLILRCASDTYKLASREIGGVRCSSLDFPHLEIQGEKRVLRLELL